MASSRFSTEARGRKPSPVLAGSSSSLSHFNRSIFMLRFPAFPPHFLRARPSLAYANLASLRQAHCAICSPYLSLSLSLSLCSDPSIALFPFAFGGQDSLASLVAINQTSISKKHFVVRQSAGFMVRPSSRDKSHRTGGSSDLLLSSPLSRISSPCCIAKLSSRFSSWSPMLRRRFLSIKIRRVQARENLERLIVPAGRTERDTGVHVLVAMQSARPPRSRESASCFLFLLRCPSCASRVRRSRSRDEMEVSEI